MDDYSRILRGFGFDPRAGEAPVSLTAYTPVFRAVDSRGEWIVKRTQKPLATAQAVASWVRSMAAEGLRVVSPAGGFGENPRVFGMVDGRDEVWVVYPFIPGSSYHGDLKEISAAGELLGQIHSTLPTHDFGLKTSETVVAVEAHQIELDIESILRRVRSLSPGERADIEESLSERREEYILHALPSLMEAHLPLANCVWDFKASNLIYPSNQTPVLVDPDSGGRIPRAYDLAIAALLFHNEGMGPGRLFNTVEWAAFLGGYGRHLRLTDEESRTWGDLLLCAWVDEALWLLREDNLGWSDPRQSRMLMSLLTTDLSAFPLMA